MMIVDQPIGLRMRPGRGSDSASAAGAGSFGEWSDNGLESGADGMPTLIKGAVPAMQTEPQQGASAYHAGLCGVSYEIPPSKQGGRMRDRLCLLCHSGMVRQHQTRNLEIPGSMLRIAPE